MWDRASEEVSAAGENLPERYDESALVMLKERACRFVGLQRRYYAGGLSVFRCLLGRDRDGVIAGGAGGDRRGILGGLGVALAVGGAYLDGVLAGTGVPVVDPKPPGVHVELGGERRVVPFLAVVGGDLDPFYPPGRRPGDAAYFNGAGLKPVAVLDGIDAGLGLDRAFLRPAAFDPIGVEVPVGELYLGEPLGG